HASPRPPPNDRGRCHRLRRRQRRLGPVRPGTSRRHCAPDRRSRRDHRRRTGHPARRGRSRLRHEPPVRTGPGRTDPRLPPSPAGRLPGPATSVRNQPGGRRRRSAGLHPRRRVPAGAGGRPARAAYGLEPAEARPRRPAAGGGRRRRLRLFRPRLCLSRRPRHPGPRRLRRPRARHSPHRQPLGLPVPPRTLGRGRGDDLAEFSEPM
ncbi:hypothetical protein LTR94_022642, partial [Friedmanniomyces endolithicus]